jgi:hypothetical protein
MTTCTCDTHTASSNSQVLTVTQTNASSTALCTLYASTANSSQSYNIFSEGATNSILGKSYVANGVGVFGQGVYSVGTVGGIGVYGQVPAVGGIGVVGENTNTGGAGIGVKGVASGYGVYAVSSAGTAVYASGPTGLYAASTSAAFAINCNNDIWIAGRAYKQGGGFIIDHPTDPENKLLNHNFVESPEMMNVYRGRVTLDSNGEATVTLPSYFEAANENPEYILTSIGASMPGIFVAEEMKNGAFKISGGVAHKSVSWLVTAARADKWAKANDIGVEITKEPEQKGLFISPELHGHDKTKSMGPMIRKGT